MAVNKGAIYSNLKLAAVTAAALLAIGASCVLAADGGRYSNPQNAQLMSWLPKTPPLARIPYGTDSPLQYGDLRLPKSKAPTGGYPVIILIHGGGYLSEWNIDSTAPLAEALSELGYAVWNIEYRRLGNTGGGYPNTFKDVGNGADALRAIAGKYDLDLGRVIAVGHSAGGQLAYWLAERGNLGQTSPLYSSDPVKLKGVVALSALTDIETTASRRPGMLARMGVREGPDAKEFYAQVSPIELLPLRVPAWAIDEGTDLNGETGFLAWRNKTNETFVKQAKEKGDDIHSVLLERANHFDLIDPQGPAFDVLKRAIYSLMPLGN